MRIKLFLSGLIYFLFILIQFSHAQDENKDYLLKRDFPEKFNLKIEERIKNSADYIIIDYYLKEGLFGNPDYFLKHRLLDAEELNFKVKTDIKDALVYAVGDFFIRADLGKSLRKLYARLTGIELTQEKNGKKFKTNAPFTSKQLNPIEEKIRLKQHELSSINGTNVETEVNQQRLEIEINQLKAELAKERPLKLKIGIDTDTDAVFERNLKNSEINNFKIGPLLQLQIYNGEFSSKFLHSLNKNFDILQKELLYSAKYDFPIFKFYPSIQYNVLLEEPFDKTWNLKLEKQQSNFLTIKLENKYEIENETFASDFSMIKLFPEKKISVELLISSDWKEIHTGFLTFKFQM